jgi:hypothetical protein
MTLYSLSGEHVAAFDGLEHGPEIIAVGLGQFHVVIDWSAVEPFGLGDPLGTLGKDFGQAAA